MTFWIAIALLCAITLFLLASPLWRKPKTEAMRAEYDLNVFKDQLKEIERDVERGMISEEEAETARTEVQRRLLLADDARKGQMASVEGLSKRAVVVSAFVGFVVVIGSLVLYTKLGQPGYSDMPFASRDIQNERQQVDTKGMVEGIALLKKRLEADPNDIDSWVLLGRTLRVMNRLDEALDAYRGALKYSNRHPAILADFAEAKIYTNQGEVDSETVQSLKESLQQDPIQMKALFYMGYAQLRGQDYKAAIQTWTDLLAISPPQAGWLDQVHEQITMAAKAGDLNTADFKPSDGIVELSQQRQSQDMFGADQAESTQPGPSGEDVKNAAEMSAEERSAMIKSMVDRLAAKLKENPDDLAGWKRLLRAYQVMGDTENASLVQARIKELEGR